MRPDTSTTKIWKRKLRESSSPSSTPTSRSTKSPSQNPAVTKTSPSDMPESSSTSVTSKRPEKSPKGPSSQPKKPTMTPPAKTSTKSSSTASPISSTRTTSSRTTPKVRSTSTPKRTSPMFSTSRELSSTPTKTLKPWPMRSKISCKNRVLSGRLSTPIQPSTKKEELGPISPSGLTKILFRPMRLSKTQNPNLETESSMAVSET